MNPTAARRSADSVSATEIVESVHVVMKTVLHHAAPSLEAAGCSMGQFWTLHLVSSLDNPSVSSVSRHLAISAPSVSANLDLLEKAGLVVRQRSAKDRRAVIVALTPKGRKVETRLWGEIARIMAQASAEVPAEDLATAARVFRSILQQLESWPAPPEVAA
ncbi:MAG TPA: MarR family winged helix-turn-helix transcriptional regulator [Thermoplasmata archaeon]|nr:MarR family winged helix-turn-helix transcriptional regulator [Thermoplasmata archaeon]